MGPLFTPLSTPLIDSGRYSSLLDRVLLNEYTTYRRPRSYAAPGTQISQFDYPVGVVLAEAVSDDVDYYISTDGELVITASGGLQVPSKHVAILVEHISGGDFVGPWFPGEF